MKLLPVLVLLAVLLSQQFICRQDWDIVFLLELTHEAVYVLNALLNRLNANPACTEQYSEVHSDRLPVELAGAWKEIYAYLYRRGKVSNFAAVVHQEQITQYHVNGQNYNADIFFRPPFVAYVQVNIITVPELACMPNFVLIGIHTRPARTYSEVNGLVNVYDWARQYSENALILGDLNADCGTFGRVEKQKSVLYRLSLRLDFKWLVMDRRRTNVGGKRCAYDRIIAARIRMMPIALHENVRIPQWGGQLQLSDHYPVSVDLKCPPQNRRRRRQSSGSPKPWRRVLKICKNRRKSPPLQLCKWLRYKDRIKRDPEYYGMVVTMSI